jgi:hypothetical protein
MMSGRVPAELISSLIPETKNINTILHPQRGAYKKNKKKKKPTRNQLQTHTHERERSVSNTGASLSISVIIEEL